MQGSPEAGSALPLLDLMAQHGPDATRSASATPVRDVTDRPCRTPSRFALIGRLGGLSKSARHDAREGTAAARAGLRARFVAEADPTGRLSEAERGRRADALMRLHMARLAVRSAEVRSGRASRAG
jgi:hypothetical protein